MPNSNKGIHTVYAIRVFRSNTRKQNFSADLIRYLEEKKDLQNALKMYK